MRSYKITGIAIGLFLVLASLYLGCGEPEGGELLPVYFVTVIDQIETRSTPKSLDFYGDTLIVAEHNNGFSAYDISNPSSITLIDYVPEAGNCKKVHVEDELNALFVSTNNQTYIYYLDSLTVNNNSILGDEGSDHILTSVDFGEVDDDGEPWETDYIRVLKADGISSLNMVDVFLDTSDFENDGIWYFEKETDVIYLDWLVPVFPSGLSYINDEYTIAVSLREVGVAFADITVSPTWISDVDTPGIARDLVQNGNYLYVADDYFGVAIIDISDVQNPVYLKNFKVDGFDHILKVAVHYNRLVLLDEYDGLVLLDIEDPIQPVEISQQKIREPSDLKFNPGDGYLYVTSFEKGITVFNLLY